MEGCRSSGGVSGRVHRRMGLGLSADAECECRGVSDAVRPDRGVCAMTSAKGSERRGRTAREEIDLLWTGPRRPGRRPARGAGVLVHCGTALPRFEIIVLLGMLLLALA